MEFQNYSKNIKLADEYSRVNFLKKTISLFLPLHEKVTRENFEYFCELLYDVTKQFVGTECVKPNRTGSGGSHDDIRVAMAAGFGFTLLNDYYTVSSRRPNPQTAAKIKHIIETNNVDALIKELASLERKSSHAISLAYLKGRKKTEEIIEEDEPVVLIENPFEDLIAGGALQEVGFGARKFEKREQKVAEKTPMLPLFEAA